MDGRGTHTKLWWVGLVWWESKRKWALLIGAGTRTGPLSEKIVKYYLINRALICGCGFASLISLINVICFI